MDQWRVELVQEAHGRDDVVHDAAGWLTRVRVCEVVEGNNLVPIVQEPADQMRPDKSGTTRYQNLHRNFLHTALGEIKDTMPSLSETSGNCFTIRGLTETSDFEPTPLYRGATL